MSFVDVDENGGELRFCLKNKIKPASEVKLILPFDFENCLRPY